MKDCNRVEVIRNYYRATNALLNIGILEDLPEDLKNICLEASRATSKIINYVNDNLQRTGVNNTQENLKSDGVLKTAQRYCRKCERQLPKNNPSDLCYVCYEYERVKGV